MPSTPGQHHDSFHESIARWVGSGLTDGAAAATAAAGLAAWLDSYPTNAGDIRSLALGAAYVARTAGRPDRVVPFAETGLLAQLLAGGTGWEDYAARVLLTVLGDSARLDLGVPATGDVLEAGEFLDRVPPQHPIRGYLELHLATLAARRATMALEDRVAAELYQAAVATQSLLDDAEHFAHARPAWERVVFGGASRLVTDGDQLGAELLRRDLERTFWDAWVGRGTAARYLPGAGAAAIGACERWGLLGSFPLLLRPSLLEVDRDDLEERLPGLLGFTEATADPASWRVMLHGAALSAALAGGADDRVDELVDAMSADLPSCRDLATVALSLTGLAAAPDRIRVATAAELVDRVVRPLVDGGDALAGSAYSLFFRRLYDPFLGRSVARAGRLFREQPTSEHRRLLSVLLDGTRSPRAAVLPIGAEPGSLPSAMAAALDRLGRLEVALQSRPGTVVVIFQQTDEGHLVISASAATGIEVEEAPAELGEALQALTAAQFRALEEGADFAALGSRAFGLLPAAARSAITDAGHVVLVPDLSGMGVPYELLHDGDGFLGLSTALARVQSLASLLQAVEPPVVPASPQRRAVCVASAEVPGRSRLAHATGEVAAVRALLGEEGWDCPAVGGGSVEGWHVASAAELAGVVHVAAHGDIGADDALILGKTARLTARDIEGGDWMPRASVFVNACALGRARELGAGVGRGMAFALAAAGAPVVIANQLPVDDATASRLAVAFYEHARNSDVGTALAAARRSVAEGVPPVLWASTVLIGDPARHLAGPPPPGDTAGALLRAFTDPEAGDEARAAALLAVSNDSDPRLEAALRWVEHFATIDPEDPPDQLDDLADLADELGHPHGAAVIRWWLAAGLSEDDPERRRRLEEATAALRRVAATGHLWWRLLVEASAALHRLDSPPEPRPGSGVLSVNDMSDPAVAMVWNLTRSFDLEELRRVGALRPRSEPIDLDEVAWNAIVLGQQGRFGAATAWFGVAASVTAAAVRARSIARISEPEVRRVVAGMLPHLWSTQRLVHLDHARARSQSGALAAMIGAVDGAWSAGPPVPGLAEWRAWLAEWPGETASGGRFAAALAALDGASGVKERTAALTETLGGLDPHRRAEAYAWVLGVLLERCSGLAAERGPGSGRITELLDVRRYLDRSADESLAPYLAEGARRVEDPMPFLDIWRGEDIPDAEP